MQFGYLIELNQPRIRSADVVLSDIVEQASMLEAGSAFTGLWAGEHHSIDDYSYPLLPTLAHIASRFPGMRVGTSVVLLPLHNPVEVAQFAVMLDLLARDVTLGVALGYRKPEFDLFGVEVDSRASLLVHGVRQIRSYFEADTPHERGDDPWLKASASSWPKPAKPIPIVVGATRPRAIERAARLGDGYLAVPFAPSSQLEGYVEHYRKVCASLGKPTRVILRQEALVAKTSAAAWRAAERYFGETFRKYEDWGHGIHFDVSAAREYMQDRSFLIGSPDEVVEKIAELRSRLNPDEIVLRMQGYGMPQTEVLRSVELFESRVHPHFA